MTAPALLELFAGYGGLGRAAENALGARTVAVAEWDAAPSKVLARRFPGVPNLQDVTTADWGSLSGIDVLSGGSPCQDLSMAGHRGGMTEGTRSNLWVSQREAIATLRPKFVVWENVRGAYSAKATCTSDPAGETGVLRALGRVLGDLTTLGYDAEWRGIEAYDVGAPHHRARVFLLAWDRDQVPVSSDQEKIAALWDDSADMWRKPDPSSLYGVGDPFMDRIPTSGSLRAGSFAPRTVWNKPRRGKDELTFPTPVVYDGMYAFRAPGLDGPAFATFIVSAFSPTPSLSHPRIADMIEHSIQKYGRKTALTGSVAGWGPFAPAVRRWEQVLGRPAPKPTVPYSEKGEHNVNPWFAEWVMGLEEGWICDLVAPVHTHRRNLAPEQITYGEARAMCGNGVVIQQAEAALRDMHAHTAHA